MLKKILSTLAASAMVAAGLTAATTTPAHAEANITCANGTKTAYQHVNDGSGGNDEWNFTGTVNYRYCRNADNGARWVVPLWFNGKYDFEGDSMSCSSWTPPGNDLEYVSFDPTFFDWQGNTHNPGWFAVPCDSDTVINVTQTYSTDKRLFWTNIDGSVKAPKFKADIHTKKAAGLWEVDTTLGAFFSAVILN